MIHIAPVVIRRAALLVLAGLLAGLLLGWWLWHPRTVVEPPAPAVQLPSGAVVAERVPDAPLPPVAREAARELGGTVARAGSVTVQPTVKESSTADGICLCVPDPVRVDWTLTSLRDGSSRMSWYTDDGTITEAVDIPASGVSVRRERPWAAGVSYSMDMSQRRAAGLWVDRDVGRLRLGLEISQRDGGTATLRAGFRF